MITNKKNSCCTFLDKCKSQHGFTLIEMAVVLVIVSILVGSFIGSFASRVETTKRDNAKEKLKEIKSAVLGFASQQGRIPCPTTTTGGGQEQPLLGGVCNLQHGFVPARSLGMNGAYNSDNLLIDPWGHPYRYSVTVDNASAFTTSGVGGIQSLGMGVLTPDLTICSGDSANPTTCSAGLRTIVDNAPFVILSLGKDGANFVGAVAPNTDQGENAGEALVVANAGGENVAYTVGNNRVFVSKAYSSIDSAAGLFDDLIVWESQYVLYSRMIEAGQLP